MDTLWLESMYRERLWLYALREYNHRIFNPSYSEELTFYYAIDQYSSFKRIVELEYRMCENGLTPVLTGKMSLEEWKANNARK